ncbi:hypothetical protein [Sinosporangium siamense]|uniref:Uncharacterized protein n=1 Tax=Sinosporangium siamense TaxID=1367973 RepID=A0A919V3R1_9ACTN|nr:hypothetical protein [Sinosporangium siamense]GII91200.1 hypothetical protein Ssi02_14310 [Sinosporangium siamense]
MALRADAMGIWSYRRLHTVPGAGESPSAAARRLTGGAGPDAVVHSTSWRYLPEGQVVLTFAVCPDPRPELPATRLTTPALARGAQPCDPAPADLRWDHVATHAIRHLAFLQATDDVVRAALAREPLVAAALARASHAPAGEIVP